VICVVPALTPVTRPVLAPIVATVVDEDAHAIVRPVSTVLSAARTTALSWSVAPASTEGLAGSIVTDATGGGVTVTVVEPERPSIVAVICALPVARPVTSPVFETSAMVVVLDDQTAVLPEIDCPLSSSATAWSCTVAPTATLGVSGDTRTDETVGVFGPEESPPQAATTARSAIRDVA
jgi:hypothetical protein